MLQEALAWSCGLLAAEEQALFRQLGVFVSGFTLDLAVAAAWSRDDDEWAVIGRLRTLVERSMVSLEHGDPPRDSPRYRLLESQREFALRQLEAREGELAAARDRHARAVADALFAGHEALTSTPDAQWLPRWAPNLDNVRAALDWSKTHDAASFVSLVGSSSPLFPLLDLGYEMRERGAALDAAAVAATEPELQVRYRDSGDLFVRLALAEGRFDDAARLLGAPTPRCGAVGAGRGCRVRARTRARSSRRRSVPSGWRSCTSKARTSTPKPFAD